MIVPACETFVKSLLPAHADDHTVLAHARACAIEPVVRAVLHNDTVESSMHRAANAALYRATLRRVLSSFDGMRVIVLKGTPLSQRLFDDALMRETTDLDLWISRADLSRAENALKALGYKRSPVVRMWATNQVLFEPQEKALFAVELHWALTQPPLRAPSFDDAWDQSVLCCENDMCWHELSDSHTWIALIFHAMQHVYAVKPWIDLAQAESRLACDHSSLQKYGLSRIDALVRAVISPDTPTHSFTTRRAASIIRRWYAGLLGEGARGHLIMGEDASCEAALGAASRAASMLCLDGIAYPAYAVGFYAVLGADILFDKLRHSLSH